MANPRRKARVVALQALFESDAVGHPPGLALERLLGEQELGEEITRFARELVQGVVAHRERIDGEIRVAAPLWPLEQMAKVDKNILRLAIYEVLLHNKTPLKAAINEAVELAKTFGGEASSRFVNGVLGTIAAKTKRP